MTEERHGRNAAHSGATPLSRPLAATEVPPEGLEIEVVPTDAERAALAEMNDIPAVLSLTAALRARRWRGDGLEVTGELRARVRQTCVATLEDFESDVVEPIDLRFAPQQDSPRLRSRRRDAEPEPVEHDALGDDPPDELVGGAVDLGEIASEFLTLALDPYPRKPGAEFVEPAPERADDAISPFARLRPAPDKA